MTHASLSRISPAKLTPPEMPAAQVARESLLDRALQSPTPRVLLVRAPAGFGKTTLLSQLAQRTEHKGVTVAWLTLDARDNDPARFTRCLRAATAALHNGDDDPPAGWSSDDMAVALLDAMGAIAEPFLLVLDEFEHLQDPAVIGLARALIGALPPQAQIAIGTRSTPELGLGGLRARGRVLEFDAHAMRFLPAESAEFLAQRLALPATDAAALHERTEGWPAAIWLAAAALERHPDRSAFVAGFSGSQAELADYLADDVLARLSPALRDFLLRTSLLGALNASLCDAVLGIDDSATHLKAIEDANLFLGARRDEAGWHRHHGLFEDFLRDRLARERPAEIPLIHRTASVWFETQGRMLSAIEHAIRAGDARRSVALLEAHAGSLIAEGRGGLLGRWFDALPQGALAGHPLLQVLRAWAAMFASGAGAARALLERDRPDTCDDRGLQTCLAALESILLALDDRYQEAWMVGERLLSRLPSGLDFADVALLNNMALSLLCLGQKDEARALVDASRSHVGGGRSSFNAGVCEAVAAMVDLQEARLREATARLRLAARIGDRDRNAFASLRTFLGSPLAEALHESDELEEARQILQVIVPLARSSSAPDNVICTHRLLARIEFSDGEVDKAFEVLDRLEVLGHQRGLQRVVANARLERSRIYVLQHRLDAARIELDRCRMGTLWTQPATDTASAQDTEFLAIGEIRLAIAEDRASIVLPDIDAELRRALRAGRTRRALKLRLLRALAAFRCGRTDSAHRDLADLIPIASQEGMLRLVLDEGPAVSPLCRGFDATQGLHATSPIQSEFLHRVASAFEGVCDTAVSAARTRVSPRPAPEPPAVESLTSRELRVLAAVAMGYSNSAIADRFFISPHTVRGHLRSVNTKLHTASRTQAVAVARRLGLIG